MAREKGFELHYFDSDNVMLDRFCARHVEVAEVNRRGIPEGVLGLMPDPVKQPDAIRPVRFMRTRGVFPCYAMAPPVGSRGDNIVMHWVYRVVKFSKNPSLHPCGWQCRNAKGRSCECSCRGANHGAGADNSQPRFECA